MSQTVLLGDIVQVFDGPHATPPKTNSGPVFLGVSNLDNGRLDLSNVEHLDERDMPRWTRRVLPRAKDIVFSYETRIGEAAIVPQGFYGCLGRRMGLLRVNNEEVDPDYLLYYWLGKSFQDQIKAHKTDGTTVERLHLSKLPKFKVFLPDLESQRRTAVLFKSVDDRLQLLQQKVGLLKEYKKGVMQKIFNQEIRFRDENGEEFPGWEDKKMSDTYDFIGTNSLSRDALSDTGYVKNIHYGDIHTKLPKSLSLNSKDIPFIADARMNIDELNCLQEGDLLIADASEDYADIGRTVEIIETGGLKAVGGLHTILARPKTGMMAVGFGSSLMESDSIKNQLKKIATGVSVLGISKSNVANIILRLPKLEEQRKIAEFLTVLDEKIRLEEGKLEHAKKFKQGLLQQMFV